MIDPFRYALSFVTDRERRRIEGNNCRKSVGVVVVEGERRGRRERRKNG